MLKKISKRTLRKTVLCPENGNMQITLIWHAEGLHGYPKNAENTVADKARWTRGLFEVSAKKSQGPSPIGYEQGYIAVTVADPEGMSAKIKPMLCSTEQRDRKS